MHKLAKQTMSPPLGQYYSSIPYQRELPTNQMPRWMHAGHFSLVFSQYVGSNFPADFFQKIEIFTFYSLPVDCYMIFVRGLLTIGARTSGRKLSENDQRDGHSWNWLIHYSKSNSVIQNQIVLCKIKLCCSKSNCLIQNQIVLCKIK